ncbi:MAG: CHASE domain-containing protein [Phycisphaeraceae bacterium JB051]
MVNHGGKQWVDVTIDPAIHVAPQPLTDPTPEPNTSTQVPYDRAQRRIEKYMTVGLVSTLIIILTAVVVSTMISHNRKVEENHFKLLKSQLQAEIIRRVGVYRYGLMGTRSVFAASNHVDRVEFRKLVKSRELNTEFPAATGIGYIHHVPSAKLDTFIEAARQDNYPQFKIRQLDKLTKHPDYMIIKYIEPVERNHQAVGLDIGSETNRREAATHAMLTGQVSITRHITLVQAMTEGAGFLILLPVYDSDAFPQSVVERRHHIQGWVYMTILAERLFSGVTKSLNNELQFTVYDDKTLNMSQLLYDGLNERSVNHSHHSHDGDQAISQAKENTSASGTNPITENATPNANAPRSALNDQPQYSDLETIQIGGRDWYIRIEPGDNFAYVSNANAWWAGISGVVLMVLVGMLLHVQNNATVRAREMADDMTVDLQKSMQNQKAAMQQAQKAMLSAEKANQHKSEFLATMSHEIRTPLNGILGMASVLGQSDLSTDQRNHLNTIINSSDSLLTIINDILDFSKIEAGKLELEQIICSPRQIAEGVIELIRPMTEQKNLELDLEMDHDTPKYILGDPVRLRQVMLNLLNNATKFTDKGAIKLQVSVRKLAKTNCTLLCCIRDTGMGIEEATRLKLFEKFSQADSSTTRKHGGTGLGLAICKSLVELMDGQIGIESQVGQGSNFWFTVQCPLPDEQQIKDADEQLHTLYAAPKMTLQNYNILVVDDNPINRMVASKMLQMLKANVTLAEGADDAFDKSRSTEFHLVLMDCQMPDIDGYEATHMLRNVCDRHATPGNVPIIALTANALPQDRQKCIDAGMNDFITKPLKLDVLQKTLEKWLPKLQNQTA